jgi:hypothetical protein
VSTSECRAVQVDFVLIGPQHGSGFASKQQSLYSLAKSLSLEAESFVNLACTKTPSSLVYDQPTMTVVHFCHFYKPAPKQLTPGRKDVVTRFAKTKFQVGTGAFDAPKFGPTNMKIAHLLQYTMRGVKLGTRPSTRTRRPDCQPAATNNGRTPTAMSMMLILYVTSALGTKRKCRNTRAISEAG